MNYNASRYQIKSPCKDCPERYVGCHSNCNKYAEYKIELDKEKCKFASYDRKNHTNKIRIADSAKDKYLNYKKWYQTQAESRGASEFI